MRGTVETIDFSKLEISQESHARRKKRLKPGASHMGSLSPGKRFTTAEIYSMPYQPAKIGVRQ